jgi:Tol biopolymer transport system component
VTTLLRRCLEKEVGQRRRDIGDIRAELDDVLATPIVTTSSAPAPRARPRPLLWAAVVAAAVIAAAALGLWAGRSSVPPATEARVRQITDLVGIEEMPAVSPDAKEVAFVATVDGRRQIWLRRLGGGPALQITRDAVDHDHPRWTPDSTAIVYFTPAENEGEAGTLWEIPTYGGTAARKVAPAITGADISHDGLQIATFQKSATGISLTILDRGGAHLKTVAVKPALEYFTPRWSPDDGAIAFIANEGNLQNIISVTDLPSGATREILRTTYLKGLTWLPDGSGLVYASAAGSTLRYPPGFNLRAISRDGRNDRQLTIGESYVDPEIVQSGKIVASRSRMASDIWRFPTTGSPADNVRDGTQLTHQTAQVQTPSASPDDKQIAYLSNSGGQGNIWVANTDGSGSPRPLTTESDPAVVVGLPLWSPAGNWILYIKSRAGQNSQWLIRSDGSDHHQLSDSGTGAAWSRDGRWVYFSIFSAGMNSCVYKVSVEGGERVRVRCPASLPLPSKDETTLYFGPSPALANEILKASPPNAEAVRLQQFSASRIPWYPNGYSLSPDERWIALPLKDGATTNIWAAPTDGTPMRQITDFGRRAIMIARSVSWSSDSRAIYAAVAELDADIVLLDGISAAGQ